MADRQDVRDALRAALDDVTRQLTDDVPVAEIVDDRADLAWSFDGPGTWTIYVEGEREPIEADQRIVILRGSAFRPFRRAVTDTRTVTVPLRRHS